MLMYQNIYLQINRQFVNFVYLFYKVIRCLVFVRSFNITKTTKKEVISKIAARRSEMVWGEREEFKLELSI